MEILDPDELEKIFESKNYQEYSYEKILSDSKYNFESLKSAPFFGEETLGIYVEIYRDLAERNFAPAYYELGLLYFNGEWWLEADVAKSLTYHEKAAELGNADAMFELYIYFSKGEGVEKNQQTALDWCVKSALGGNNRAAYNMGSFCARGEGVGQNLEEAIRWYKLASETGHGKASATLGVMFKTGEGVEKNEEQAESYFIKSESQGFSANRLLLDLGLKRFP